MRTTYIWNEIVVVAVAVLAVGSASCTLTSATPGAGGATGSGGAPAAAGTTGSSGAPAGVSGMTGMSTGPTDGPHCKHEPAPAAPAEGVAKLPCDIYAADGGPCVAAHSTIRALYATYAGPLYQVRNVVSGETKDVAPIAPGGFANAETQDTFCGMNTCTISLIYDQSGQGNHLKKSPPGMAKPTEGKEASAKGLTAMFGATKAYGVHIVPGVGYRTNTPCGTATGDDAETEYMVVAGDFYNGGCCFDYGNMETTSNDDGEGTMEAVYFGTCNLWNQGGGKGPWIMGDLENGLWAGNTSPYEANGPVTSRFVTGMVKGDAAGKNHWSIKIGDAQAGMLKTPFDGPRPSARYNPMRKQGAIGLGTGGDNSNAAQGNFYEGVMTAHYSSAAADDAVQANITSVYSQIP